MEMEYNIEPKSFNNALEDFFDFAEQVLKHNVHGEFKLVTTKQAGGVSVCLSKYRTVYEMTKNEVINKHLAKFKDVYFKCRERLINSTSMDNFMTWLNKQEFVISPTPQSRSKIYLTMIYRNSVRIARTIAEQAQNNPEKSDELFKNPAAVYPEHFMLHLLRLFYHCADDVDRQTIILPHIRDLENDLQLSPNQAPDVSDGYSDLMSAAKELAEDFGLGLPEADMPSLTDLKGALSQIRGDSEIRGQLKGMFQNVNMNDPSGLPTVLNKLLDRMQTTAQQTPEGIQKANEATA